MGPVWVDIANQAIRVIIVRAAAGAGLDPDQISFTAALNAAQRTMGTGPGRLSAALAATETEILSCLVPQRDGRICPRAVNKPSSPYRSKHGHTGPLSQHATRAVTIITPELAHLATSSGGMDASRENPGRCGSRRAGACCRVTAEVGAALRATGWDGWRGLPVTPAHLGMRTRHLAWRWGLDLRVARCCLEHAGQYSGPGARRPGPPGSPLLSHQLKHRRRR